MVSMVMHPGYTKETVWPKVTPTPARMLVSGWAVAWSMDPVKLSQVMRVSVGHLGTGQGRQAVQCACQPVVQWWYRVPSIPSTHHLPIPAWLRFGSANPCSHRAIHPHNLRKILCLAGMGLAVNTIVNTRITALDLYCIHIVHLTGLDRSKVFCHQQGGICSPKHTHPILKHWPVAFDFREPPEPFRDHFELSIASAERTPVPIMKTYSLFAYHGTFKLHSNRALSLRSIQAVPNTGCS